MTPRVHAALNSIYLTVIGGYVPYDPPAFDEPLTGGRPTVAAVAPLPTLATDLTPTAPAHPVDVTQMHAVSTAA